MSGLTLSGHRPRRVAAGLSLVELMVGIAVGLMVVAAASYVAVNQITDNRRLLLETQVQQDLRATADLIARDLRRAGYWGAAQSGVWFKDGPAVASNPYIAIEPGDDGALSTEVRYRYSRGGEDGAVDADTELFGFKLENATIKMLVGGAWQALTDANTLKVTRFDIIVSTKTVAMNCFKECAGGGDACWPRQQVRSFTIAIEGEAVWDASVKRSVRDNLRLRNDAPSGACPA